MNQILFLLSLLPMVFNTAIAQPILTLRFSQHQCSIGDTILFKATYNVANPNQKKLGTTLVSLLVPLFVASFFSYPFHNFFTTIIAVSLFYIILIRFNSDKLVRLLLHSFLPHSSPSNYYLAANI